MFRDFENELDYKCKAGVQGKAGTDTYQQIKAGNLPNSMAGGLEAASKAGPRRFTLSFWPLKVPGEG